MIFCLLVSTIMMGQVSTTVVAQHLEFMGVPMQGTIEDFQKELEKKGLVVKEHNPKYRNLVMQGEFYGKMCDVRIDYTPSKHIPYEVDIQLGHSVRYDITKSMEIYSDLEKKYRKYKEDRFHRLGRQINFEITNSELEVVGHIEFVCGISEDDSDNKISYTDYTNFKKLMDDEMSLIGED